MTDADRAIAAYALWRRERVWRLTVATLFVIQLVGGLTLAASGVAGWLSNTILFTYVAVYFAVIVKWAFAVHHLQRTFPTLTKMPCPDCGFPLPRDDDAESRTSCPECGKPHSTVSARRIWQKRIMGN
jgi:endogenous inhibitor of DNA gyrase (YacG/DUF329 family)